MGKVKEPAATYYSRPMLNALRNHIKDRIEQMDDAVLLSKLAACLIKMRKALKSVINVPKNLHIHILTGNLQKNLKKRIFDRQTYTLPIY